nr:DUF3558 family protein [Allokutzneria sp. NRRL B-24872]
MTNRHPIITALVAISLTTSCSPSLSGKPSPAPSQVPLPTTTSSSQITAVDVCGLMTPADFPYRGEQPKPAEPADGPFPGCSYQVKPSPDVASVLTVGLTFFPGRKLGPVSFGGRQEVTVAGKRAALGQGDLQGNPGECELFFESARGEWGITVVDSSAPGRDGCATAKHIGERVAPRVP